MGQDTLDSLSDAVSEDAWEHRKAFVGFGPADEAILRELRPVALQYADEVMDELYGRWLQFPELKRFFPDAATLSGVKALQRQYFVSLTGGEYGAALPGASPAGRGGAQEDRAHPSVVHGGIQHLS